MELEWKRKDDPEMDDESQQYTQIDLARPQLATWWSVL